MADQYETNEHALLKALFNSVHGLIYLYTEDGRLVKWNQRHEEMTGYTSEELMNFRAEDWFDEEDRVKLARAWPKVFSEGYSEMEATLINKEGERVPYFFTGSLVVVDGKPHMVGVGIDISERKRQEQMLQKSERLLKRAEEVAQLGSWDLDILTNELFCSEEMYRILGLETGHPLTYELFLGIVHPDDRYKTLNWYTSDIILLVPNFEWFSSYKFCLKNLNTDVTVKVNMHPDFGPLYYGLYTHWILSINYAYREICLEDGSLWKVSGLDDAIFFKWLPQDTLIIGTNTGFFSGTNPNILINVPMYNYVEGRCIN